MKMHRNAKVLARQIRKQEESRISSHAVTVERELSKSEELVLEARKALEEAEARLKKQRRALKKFNKTGKVSALKPLGVN